GSTNTGRAMLYTLIGYRIFAKVMSNHFRFDTYLRKFLAVVNMNCEADHIRKNNHVPSMSSDIALQLAFSSKLYFLTQFPLIVIHISADTLVKRSALPCIEKRQQSLYRQRL